MSVCANLVETDPFKKLKYKIEKNYKPKFNLTCKWIRNFEIASN